MNTFMQYWQQKWEQLVAYDHLIEGSHTYSHSALRWFDRSGSGMADANLLKQTLQYYGDSPLSAQEVDDLIQMGGGGQINIQQLAQKLLSLAS